MIYLGRTVFPFTINWAQAINRQVQFDLREESIGFGAEYFTPTKLYAVTAWDFSIKLKSGADFLAWDTFADSLFGRLSGFWLPCPLQAGTFLSGISTTQFKIKWEDLSTTWNNRPDQHLLITFGGASYAAQIQNVVDNGDGTETITLTGATALPIAPTAGAVLSRLHYVRFADDNESFALTSPTLATVKLSVVELPLEYTAAAAGLQPIYLYHFNMRAPVSADWYYTSFAASVASSGKLYVNYPITHGAIKLTNDGNSNQLDIMAQPNQNVPLSLLFGLPPGAALWVDVSVCYLATPDAQTLLWRGYVSTVEDDGQKQTAHCDTRLRWLKTKVPRYFVGTTCNNHLYDPQTCKAKAALFSAQGIFHSAVPGQSPVIKVLLTAPFNLPQYESADWFAQGAVEAGIGVTYEVRSIIHSSFDGTYLTLTLNAPFLLNAPGPGLGLEVTTGCDHQPQTCANKFNNFVNFAGFVDVPDDNLSLEGLNTTSAQGNKKI
jgi:uncharacterized phage protein (TIGR02218 family)